MFFLSHAERSSDVEIMLNAPHLASKPEKALAEIRKALKENVAPAFIAANQQRCRCVQKQDARAKDQECGRVLRGLGRKNEPSPRDVRLWVISRGDMQGDML